MTVMLPNGHPNYKPRAGYATHLGKIPLLGDKSLSWQDMKQKSSQMESSYFSS